MPYVVVRQVGEEQTAPTVVQVISPDHGANGSSAYQVWLSAGNSGSQTDFLTSLRGPVGPGGAAGIPAILDGGNF